MKRKSLLVLFSFIGLVGVPMLAAASGDHGHAHSSHGSAKPVVATQMASGASMTDGEIRKVDKETGKITIKHGKLKNLDMPPMTMAFQVKDKAMLDQVKPGDQVNFVADKVNGKLTVMQIESRK